ncbi:MAG: hypothetical protein O3B84_05510 [Chloroflexi bacterium]|nr:hypothetical protein [Chloroflexota bacterium]
MRRQGLVPTGVVALTAMLMLLGAPSGLQGQGLSREAVEAAARDASPHSATEAMAYWEAEVARRVAEATARVYDPAKSPDSNLPRTPWGAPDLRGYYLTAMYTPMQRPNGVTKPLYTPEEAVEAFRFASTTDAGVDPATVHYDWKEFGMDAWQSPVRPNLRTGLITDTPDGRVPALTPEAQQRRAAAAALRRERDHQTGVQIFANLYTRCILGGGALPLANGGQPGSDSAAGAGGVTTEAQIFQTPDHVVIVQQRATDVRIIPLDGRPHLPQTVRQWYGNSRGHWEGNTLVVETTNFKDPAPDTNFQGSTDALQIVERFTPVDANTLRYEYTLTDPKTWARSWSVEAPLPRIDPPLYEFACHEQNYGLINLVMGAQIRATEGLFDPRDPRAASQTIPR